VISDIPRSKSTMCISEWQKFLQILIFIKFRYNKSLLNTEYSKMNAQNTFHSSRAENNDKISISIYEGCPESIQPFSISWELVKWPWYNMAASQRRPYCSSVNSHSPVGLVSRQWDAVDWACVLCDRRIHKSPAFQRRF